MKYKNKNFIDAILCTIDGLKVLFREKAAKRELLLVFFSIFYIMFMKPDIMIILWLLILPLIILAIEAINTAIEYLCDEITMELSDKIKKIKDLGSVAVFFSLVAYVLVIIFNFEDNINLFF